MSAIMESGRICSLVLVYVQSLVFALWILIVSVDYVECEVRLVGGPDTAPNAGRVEVWNTDSSRWIAVCASYWDFRDGQVVCRELGYPGTLSVEYYYRNVNMTDTVGGYQCYGTETTLSRCRRSPYTLCLGLQAGVKCSAPGYMGCFYVFNPSGYSPIFWTYIAYSNWTVGSCIRKSRRLLVRDSDWYPQYTGVRQRVCWYTLRLSRFEGRRRSDAMCNLNCVTTAGEGCGGSTTLAVYDVTLGYCKDPGIITNGTREIHHAADEFYFGTVMRFRCNIGFELLGTTTIQCVIDKGRNDVIWNNSLPTCSKLQPPVTDTTEVTEEPSTSLESTHASQRVTDVTVTTLDSRVSPGVTDVTVAKTHVSQSVTNVTVTTLDSRVSPGVTDVTVAETHVTPKVANVTVTAPETYVYPDISNVTVTSAPEAHVTPRVANVTVTAPETHVTQRVADVTVTEPDIYVYPGVSNVTVSAPEIHVTPRVANATVTAPESLVTQRVVNVTVTQPDTYVHPGVSNVTVTAPDTRVTKRVDNVTVTEPETHVYPRVSNVNITASETRLSPRVTDVTVTVPGTHVPRGVPDVTATTPVPEVKGTHEPDPVNRQRCLINLGLIIAIVVGVAISILLHATLLTICFFHIRGRRVKRYSVSSIDKSTRVRRRRLENERSHRDDNRAQSAPARYSTVRRGERSRVGGESNNNATSHDVIVMQRCDSEWVENEVYESVGPPDEAT